MEWLQFFLYLGILVVSTPIMGRFLYRVLDANGKTFLDPVVKPLERCKLTTNNNNASIATIPFTVPRKERLKRLYSQCFICPTYDYSTSGRQKLVYRADQQFQSTIIGCEHQRRKQDRR